MTNKEGIAYTVEGMALRCRVYPAPCTLRPTLWLFLAALMLLLMAAPPYAVSAESLQEPNVGESATVSDIQQFDFPSYRDPQSSLPGVGMTSQIFTALGAVLGLMALAYYLYKRIAMRGSSNAFHDGTIRILSRTYLGQKESLCLVQVGNDVLLLGQTSAGITLLHALPPAASAAAVTGGRDGEGEVRSGTSGQTTPRPPAGYARERFTGITGLEGRLRRLNGLWRAPAQGSDRGEALE